MFSCNKIGSDKKFLLVTTLSWSFPYRDWYFLGAYLSVLFGVSGLGPSVVFFFMEIWESIRTFRELTSMFSSSSEVPNNLHFFRYFRAFLCYFVMLCLSRAFSCNR